MARNEVITVAIIGGGLAGATLANALTKHSHINVQIYESAPQFSERGAAVSINMAAQKALDNIGGPIADVVERAGGMAMVSSRAIMAAGPNATEIVIDLQPEQRGKSVHRAALLQELLKSINDDKNHTNKKVTRIEEQDNGKLKLQFEDNTVSLADAVIGADGVRGYLRSYILGENHPATSAQRAGFWDARSLVPLEQAKKIFGEELFTEHRQYGYICDGGFLLHDIHDEGQMVQFAISGMLAEDDWTDDKWSRVLSRQALEKAIEGWTDPPLTEKIVDVMLRNPYLKAYAQTHHGIDAPTYAKGPVCLMGDSAHCVTPWQGSGAGQAIEDALILDVLLGEVHDAKQLPAAFQAYDQVRRPRSQQIVHSSIEVGVIMCGRGKDTGLDIAKIRESLPGRWEFIYGIDLMEHQQEALAAYEKLCNGNEL